MEGVAVVAAWGQSTGRRRLRWEEAQEVEKNQAERMEEMPEVGRSLGQAEVGLWRREVG